MIGGYVSLTAFHHRSAKRPWALRCSGVSFMLKTLAESAKMSMVKLLRRVRRINDVRPDLAINRRGRRSTDNSSRLVPCLGMGRLNRADAGLRDANTLASPAVPLRASIAGVLTILSASLFLTACASTPEPRIVTKEVRVPIAIKCAADPGADPQFSDTPDALKAAADIFVRVQLLLAGRAQRDGRLAELKAANAGCR